MANCEQVREQATAGRNHACVLLLGDSDNNIVYKTRIRFDLKTELCEKFLNMNFPNYLYCSDAQLMNENEWKCRVRVRRAQKDDDVSVNLISQDWGEIGRHFTPIHT